MLIRIKKSLESPITWRTQTFSIPMDIEMGVDLKNTYEIDVKKVNSKEEMKNAIESSFMEISSGTKT